MRDADKILVILLPTTFIFYILTYFVIADVTKKIEDIQSRVISLENTESVHILFNKGDMVGKNGIIKEANFLIKGIKFYE